MMKFLTFALGALLALPLAANAQHAFPPQARHHAARHQDLAMRAEGTVQLHKRVSNSKWSYYDTQTGNAGACGQFLQNSQYVVAMNVPQYNGGDCFKTITLSWGGKTAQATIQDACPGCPYGGLDLSPSLFEYFAPLGKGIIWDGEWWFGGAPPPPTTTWTPPPPPTTTWTPPPPTTTWTPPPTTTWTPPTTSSSPPPTTSSTPSSTPLSASSSVVPSSAFASASASASGFDRPTGNTTVSGGNLEALSQAVLSVANLAIAGAAVPPAA